MTWLYSAAILLGSCLLFLVQPLCAKMLLPHLGGTPAVWTTCMVFFQAGLLLGYAYAHYGPRWLGVGPHALVHVAALVGTYFLLPIRFPESVSSDYPVLWLLMTLTLNVGLPFVLIAAGAPLLQRWYVNKMPGASNDPYYLYAASNVGSFIALVLFPFALEPFFRMSELSEWWKHGFLGLAGLIAFCVPIQMLREPFSSSLSVASARGETVVPPPPDRWLRIRWIILALIPSSLLLSVTTYATTDIAAIPLLWLVPMAIYLLTFVLAFASKPIIPRTLLVRWLPLVVLVLVILLLCERPDPMVLVLVLHLFGFFWLAMLCHSELSRTRPPAEHLTTFYLCLALGGVLGGIVNALIAPVVFWDLLEYPLMIVLACYFAPTGGEGQGATLARPTFPDAKWTLGLGGLTVLLVLALQSRWLGPLPAGPMCVAAMFGVPLLLCYTTQAAPTRFALGIAAVLSASWFYHGVHGPAAYRERSWFGVHRVTVADGFHRLVHGNTVHGQQDFSNAERRREPLAYYGKEGPAGDIFQSLKGDARLRHVGLVGLGAGTLAAYADAGQRWTFFEIDPSVKRIAENPKLFTFLSDAPRGTIEPIVLGDARLQLELQNSRSAQQFGVLVVDAFGSDAIPMHLLTDKAMQIYLDRLEPTGVLALHISNRYVDLEPVLANLAAEKTLACHINDRRKLSDDAAGQGVFASVWIVIARHEADLAPILTRPSWRPARGRPDLKVWSDQSSNLLQVFRWRELE